MATAIKKIVPKASKNWSPSAKNLIDRRCSSSVLYARSLVQKVMQDRSALKVLWEADCEFLENLFGSFDELEGKLVEVLHEGTRSCGVPTDFLQSHKKEMREIAEKARRWFTLYREDWPIEQLIVIEEIYQSLDGKEKNAFWLYYLLNQELREVAANLHCDTATTGSIIKSVGVKVKNGYLIDDHGFFKKRSDDWKVGYWLANKIGTPIPSAGLVDLDLMVGCLKKDVLKSVVLCSTKHTIKGSAKDLGIFTSTVVRRLTSAKVHARLWLSMAETGFPPSRKTTIIDAWGCLPHIKMKAIFWDNIVLRPSSSPDQSALKSEIDKVICYLESRFDCDHDHVPIQRKVLMPEPVKMKVSYITQKTYLAIWSMAGGNENTRYDLDRLSNEIYPGVDRNVATPRILCIIRRLEKFGWVRRVRVSGEDCLEVKRADSLLSQGEIPDDNVMHETPVGLRGDYTLYQNRWVSLKKAAEVMVRKFSEQDNFNLVDSFETPLAPLGRDVLREIEAIEVDRNILMLLVTYCRNLGIFEADEELSRGRRNFYRLGEYGKKLLSEL